MKTSLHKLRDFFLSVWGLGLAGTGYFLFQIRAKAPASIAVHFDVNGHPNGFSSRESFVTYFAGLLLLANLILLAVTFAIEKIPVSMINWPNKDYWFATPERMRQVYDRIEAMMALIGSFTNGVMLFAVYAVFQRAGGKVPFQIPLNGGLKVILAAAAILIVVSFLMARPSQK